MNLRQRSPRPPNVWNRLKLVNPQETPVKSDRFLLESAPVQECICVCLQSIRVDRVIVCHSTLSSCLCLWHLCESHTVGRLSQREVDFKFYNANTNTSERASEQASSRRNRVATVVVVEGKESARTGRTRRKVILQVFICLHFFFSPLAIRSIR